MSNRIPARSAKVILCACAAGIAFAHSASAQGVPSAGDPSSRVEVGQRVWVTTLDGRHLDGSVESVTPQELVVRKEQPNFSRSEAGSKVTVTRLIWREVGAVDTTLHDPIWDGLVKGSLIGSLSVGAGSALVQSGLCPGCGADGLGEAFAIGAGIGAGVGALIDYSRRGRAQVYRAARSVSVVPAAGPNTLALRGVVSW